MKKMTQVPFLALFLIALNMPQNAWGANPLYTCCVGNGPGRFVKAICIKSCDDFRGDNICQPILPMEKCNSQQSNSVLSSVKIVTKEEFEKLQQNKPENKK